MMPAIVLGRVGQHRQSAQIWYEKFIAAQQHSEKENQEGRIINASVQYEQQSEYALKKAVFELTLHIIQTADQQQKNNVCVRDLICLQQQ